MGPVYFNVDDNNGALLIDKIIVGTTEIGTGIGISDGSYGSNTGVSGYTWTVSSTPAALQYSDCVNKDNVSSINNNCFTINTFTSNLEIKFNIAVRTVITLPTSFSVAVHNGTSNVVTAAGTYFLTHS